MGYIALLIPIGAIAMAFGIVYIIITTRHRENMALIESGINPTEDNKKEKNHNKLRGALLFVFVPIGILVGRMTFKNLGMEAEVCQLVFAFLFGGIGLAITYILEQTWLRNRDNKESID